jgi:signal peptidase
VMREKERISWQIVSRRIAELVLVILASVLFFTVILLHFFGWRFDAVLTGSMSPTYPIGGMVVIAPVDPLEVRTGDVITYKPPFEHDFLITHRVIEIQRQDNSFGFQTKGDAVDSPDGYFIPAENVVGQVLLYIPYFGHFAKFVKTPVGFALCLILPCILLVGDEFWKIRARLRSKRNRMNVPGGRGL